MSIAAREQKCSIAFLNWAGQAKLLLQRTSVSVTSTAVDAGRPTHTRVRADSPLEIPNFSHLDARPQPRHQPWPELPALPLEPGAQVALVKFFVDTEGRARVPVVISAATPELGAAVVAAVKQWRFDPPRLDGKPVIVLETYTFRFGAKP